MPAFDRRSSASLVKFSGKGMPRSGERICGCGGLRSGSELAGEVMTTAINAELVIEKRPIAVVGTGLVGAGWAIVFARAGHLVRLFDSVPGAAERAMPKR
jgi:hypothetical protein